MQFFMIHSFLLSFHNVSVTLLFFKIWKEIRNGELSQTHCNEKMTVETRKQTSAWKHAIKHTWDVLMACDMSYERSVSLPEFLTLSISVVFLNHFLPFSNIRDSVLIWEKLSMVYFNRGF